MSLLVLFLAVAGAPACAVEPDLEAMRVAQVSLAAKLAGLEAVAKAALALPREVEGQPTAVEVEDLVWKGTDGNVEIVLASDLTELVGAQPTEREQMRIGAGWPLRVAAWIRDGAAVPREGNTKVPREPWLVERLRYVIVVFEDRYEDPFPLFGAEPGLPAEMVFDGRAAVYALDGARLLAWKRVHVVAKVLRSGPGLLSASLLETSDRLTRRVRDQLAAMFGVRDELGYGPLMELGPVPQTVSYESVEIIVFVLLGLGALMVLLVVFGRRRHRERHDMDGVQVHIATRGDDASVHIEVTTALDADIAWGEEARDGDVPGGDDAPRVDGRDEADELPGASGGRVHVRGTPLPALYAALTGAPVWRAVLDLGGHVQGDKDRLVVTLAHNIGLQARARQVAAFVRDLRSVGDGVSRLAAILEDEVAPHATRARIAIALIRWAKGSKAAHDARERLGWADPLEPHLVACLTSESDALVADACDALASFGTAAALTPLEQVYGPARTAAMRAITAITARGGDPRQGALALSSGAAGALSVHPEDGPGH